MRNPKRAFQWIVDLLNEKDIPFQVVGGLAARAYGSTRELVDIDLYIPGDRFEDLWPEVAPYVTFGPEHVVSEGWDLVFMALEYAGQKVELGDGDDVRIFDEGTQRWVEKVIDFSEAEYKMVFGRSVPVMRRERLIAYKRKLQRKVDLEDLAALRRAT